MCGKALLHINSYLCALLVSLGFHSRRPVLKKFCALSFKCSFLLDNTTKGLSCLHAIFQIWQPNHYGFKNNAELVIDLLFYCFKCIEIFSSFIPKNVNRIEKVQGTFCLISKNIREHTYIYVVICASLSTSYSLKYYTIVLFFLLLPT